MGITTSSFGIRRPPIFVGTRSHKGIDIAAPTGTEVVATYDGRVSFSGWKRGYGNVVIIEHGEGLSTLYAHLSQRSVAEGDDITSGKGWQCRPFHRAASSLRSKA